MALINIEYGSLASSDTMNKNFSYLENKMDENSDSIMTSISSILSNIATINSRLSEMSEIILDNDINLQAKLDEYKNKTKTLVQKSSMVPHWNGCRAVSLSGNYSVTANGFLILIPENNSSGTLKINSTIIEVLMSEIITLPVKDGDVISSNIELKNALFLPITEINIDNF